MGSGSYDSEARSTRAMLSGYYDTHASDARVFKQAASRTINQGMDPKAITLRECRDNADHPNTIPVILALDVTGSMGTIPVELVKHDLPNMMERLLQIHPDIALMFIAFGDHECDRAPLQIGQFEASDELLDHWLTSTWIEGGGGGNQGESYALPWLFASSSVVTDAWEKRGWKGLLITVGDEPILPNYPARGLIHHLGEQTPRIIAGFQGPITQDSILEKAEEKWEVHHIGMRPMHQSWTCLAGRYHQVPKSPHIVDTVEIIVREYVAGLGVVQPQSNEALGEGSGTIPTPSIPTPL